MWMWLLVAVPIVMFALWIVGRCRENAAIFSDENLLEIGQQIQAMKHAAIAKVGTPEAPISESPDEMGKGPTITRPEELLELVKTDRRCVLTSAGLVMFYSVSLTDDGRYSHHASVSVRGGPTTVAVGLRFLLLWARLVHSPRDRLQLHFGESGVHHAMFELSEQEHQEFSRLPTETLTPENLTAIRSTVERGVEQLRSSAR
jgi:hypothetical protein